VNAPETYPTPQWTARMYPGKVGRDHLGLGSVSSNHILRTLSPGINVLTVHPRYHSFYCFLLDEYWRRDLVRSHATWVNFFRPRDFVFALGAHFCVRPEHGDMRNVVGSDKLGPLADRRLDRYDTAFDYIQRDLGGYGLYYRSVMAEMGLIYPGGFGFPYPVDVPSDTGKALAAEFRAVIADTDYYQAFFDQETPEVPISIISAFIEHACLCQLQLPSTRDRPMLLDVFLHHGLEPEARRQTFRLFLDIAAQTGKYPVDQNSFRQLLYFGSAANGATYTPRTDVRSTHRLWKLYQAREYYAFALNALFNFLYDLGMELHGDLRPIPVETLLDHLDEALDFDALAEQLGLSNTGIFWSSTFQVLLDWLLTINEADATRFDDSCSLESPLNEHRLYELAYRRTSDATRHLTGMLAMLALIYLRFGLQHRWPREEWTINRMGFEGHLSLDGFLVGLERRLKDNATVSQIMRWLYSEYVVLQHQMVASGKLPDNTFRFQREGDRLRFYRQWNALGFMDSRFDALSTTVYELGLCGDLRYPKHALTDDGKHLLREGNVP
jgi:hypothetical protein